MDEITNGGESRCAITGKIVKPEESVAFHGQTLSAQGKAILFNRFASGAPIRLIGGDTPGLVRRFLCANLDSVIIGCFNTFLLIPVFLYFYPESFHYTYSVGLIKLSGVFVAAVVDLLYYGCMHAIFGQTLGKMAGGYRLINFDGSKPGIWTCFSRAFWYAGIASANLLSAVATDSPAFLLLFTVLGGFSAFYGLVNAIVLLVDGTYRRALHDRITGTRVVMTRKV